MQNLIITILVVLSAPCIRSVQAQILSNEPPYWCRGFNQTGNYTQGYEDEYSHRISEAVICNSTNVITNGGDKNGLCAIQAGGFFGTEYHANVSAYDFQWSGVTNTSNLTYSADVSVAYTVAKLTDAPEYAAVNNYGGVREAVYHIEEGTNAYVAFVPLFRCLSGWLSECPMELKLNDTYVELCKPLFSGDVIEPKGGIYAYEGDSYIQMVNQTKAAELTGNGSEAPPLGLSSSEAGMVRVGSLAGFAGGIAMLFALG
ncbi:hypothetical protein KC331_g1386 [Hortaea werneckii]|uniref:Uncharacterized protein n=1 Tax=Hortaea werneckii TaxID=91943 RepID=A0A3M7CGD6_HORWE|nr:hypothetical protein KC354_g13525 [Hortaea werneckii]KAI7553205.1 hypothetical protein KC331_g1386 [Hortaea werneckii]KAI7721266.1 hypothetical protein KC353_g1497 [Hortaea werneckii]RMY51125.1 hypothetical protein D0865_06514 [Hortaea werneckii]RMY57728.1 hypothetical protein D0863_12523 [Hortaea werneckii]